MKRRAFLIGLSLLGGLKTAFSQALMGKSRFNIGIQGAVEELREDGTFELREDQTVEMRENL